MNRWQNGQTDGMFNQQTPTHLNPAMFSNLNTSGQFDLNGASPYQQQQQQQALVNGSQTPTQGFPSQQQTFQPGSVVPQKRPHDGGMSGSPPPPNQISRSQTPNFNAFANQQQAGQQFAQGATPTPYGHLQQTGSAHATPSPTMQNQQFRQPSRMSNASPSPFPQPQANFANQMSAANAPNMTAQQNAMAQQGGMSMNQFGMNANMGMGNNMATSMGGQAGNISAVMAANQQRQYQMRLMQQQAAMQNRAGGNANFNMAQAQSGMQNGQTNTLAQQQHQQQQQQQHQIKRAQFLQQCGAYVVKAGRPFNPNPSIGGKPLDLYALFTCTVSGGGSGAVDRTGQWQNVANKLGFPQAQYPTAAEEIKGIFISSVALYEKAWMTAKASQKQEQARMHAQQMAGFGAIGQSSPAKSMQPPLQQNQLNQQRFNQFPPQPTQPQATPHHSQHATPVQANASLPQNGVTTPQALAGQLHRRNSSMRKQETPRPESMTAPSPHSVMPKVEQTPDHKAMVKKLPLMKDEKQDPNYVPGSRAPSTDGGYDTAVLFDLGTSISRFMPHIATVHEMGTIDTRAITLSLASGIHGEVRYALDTLSAVSAEQWVTFELEKCDDLLDVIIDCAEDQTDILADKADEVSDSIDLLSYEDILRSARTEAEALQDVPAMGTQAYDLDRAADKVLAITTILRNFSFYEHNHRQLTGISVIKWISHTLRLLGTRNMFLRTYLNLQDFYKDVVIFLSNITQSLELPSRDDALHILHFLLAFTPQPAPSFTASRGKKLSFVSFVPAIHRYLPPAVDCLAKLLARQDPNRVLYRSIFHSSGTHHNNTSEEDPIDLLTRAFALAISVLPDRNKSGLNTPVQMRIVDARKAYLTQGILAADILTTLLPSGESDVARAWIGSEDGWAASLLELSSCLGLKQEEGAMMASKTHPIQWDSESFRLNAHRSLSMIRRLALKAGKGSGRPLVNGTAKTNGETGKDDIDELSLDTKWHGFPQNHAIVGAMMLGDVDEVVMSLLYSLHELASQA